MAELNRRFGVFEEDLAGWAEKVKQDCLAKFSFEKDGRRLFAYLTDLGENFQPYHDANDLPTVFAPLWGFCAKDDPRWLETMRFGFSPDNQGGYSPGRFEGLGSVHTPHKWPLGDGQELLFAELTGDRARVERVLKKLQETVQWDGLYAEAVDENSGEIASRHWFSWPGAFIAYVLLQ